MGIEEKLMDEIPYEIGIIWNEVAKEFKLPCVTSYGALILYNCIENKNGDLNSRYAISGTNDELHFYKIHMKIEKAGAEFINVAYSLNIENEQEVYQFFKLTIKTMNNITEILRQMYDGCDPDIFWNIIRIYLGGYPDGLKVTDTDLVFKFKGGSAAQSTLIQTFDIVMGVKHDVHHETKFLKEQRKYMPEKHQKFLEFLENKFVPNWHLNQHFNGNIVGLYNDAVDSLAKFRERHFGIVHNYIIRFTNNANMQKNNVHGDKGAGGLAMEQLKDYINDTRKSITNNIRKNNLTAFNFWKYYWWLLLFVLFAIFMGFLFNK